MFVKHYEAGENGLAGKINHSRTRWNLNRRRRTNIGDRSILKDQRLVVLRRRRSAIDYACVGERDDRCAFDYERRGRLCRPAEIVSTRKVNAELRECHQENHQQTKTEEPLPNCSERAHQSNLYCEAFYYPFRLRPPVFINPVIHQPTFEADCSSWLIMQSNESGFSAPHDR